VIDFPKEWQTTRIGAAFNIKQGKSLSRRKQTGNNRRRFLRTANVFWGHLKLDTLDTMSFTDKECSTLALEPGDLLVCEGGAIGRTAIWYGDVSDCYYQNHLHRLRRVTENVLPYFIMYWMQAAMTQLNVYEGAANKTTIPNLSRSRLAEFVIPLPPFPEQKKIAAVLLKIQRAIEAQEKIIQSLRDLKKSTMQHLFNHGLRGEKTKMTEIGEIPESWEVKHISEICKERPQNGIFIKDPIWGEGYRYLNVADVYKRLIVNVMNLQKVASLHDSSKSFCLSKGDILFVRSSLKKEGIGKCCVYMENSKDTLFDCHLIRVRLEQSQINPIYFASYWITDSGQKELIRRSKTTTMTTINQKSLVEALIPFPGKEEQDYIAMMYETLQRKTELHESHKASLQDIFKTMLNKLMTGNIRVKDLDINVKEVDE
jgi:type I restriction enzyme, S subunit